LLWGKNEHGADVVLQKIQNDRQNAVRKNPGMQQARYFHVEVIAASDGRGGNAQCP
jgi:hypothetical protein